MSNWLDSPKRLGSPENDRENLSGGPDLDTVRDDDLLGRPEDEEQDNPRMADERSGKPFPTTPPDPTGDDPFVAGTLEDVGGDQLQPGHGELAEPHPIDDGPSYERDQGPNDDRTGGSTDPNNSRSHSDT